MGLLQQFKDRTPLKWNRSFVCTICGGLVGRTDGHDIFHHEDGLYETWCGKCWWVLLASAHAHLSRPEAA